MYSNKGFGGDEGIDRESRERNQEIKNGDLCVVPVQAGADDKQRNNYDDIVLSSSSSSLLFLTCVCVSTY